MPIKHVRTSKREARESNDSFWSLLTSEGTAGLGSTYITNTHSRTKKKEERRGGRESERREMGMSWGERVCVGRILTLENVTVCPNVATGLFHTYLH